MATRNRVARGGVRRFLVVLAVAFSATGLSAWGWTSFSDVAALGGFTRPRTFGNRIELRGPYSAVLFEVGTRRVDFNGTVVFLNAVPQKLRSEWMLTSADAANVIQALAAPDCPLSAVDYWTVVLDPGHGGSDPGARYGRSVDEKRLTLDMAKRVRTKLKDMGVRTEITRDRDRTMSLDERCARAQSLGADVFVSIHFNSTTDPRTGGVETYVVPSVGYPSTGQATAGRIDDTAYPCNRYDAANMYLAYCLQRGLVAYGRAEDRGIKRARFHVIKYAACPAALVECGFLSNRREAEHILQDDYRDQLAEGITRGILTYLWRVREAHYARYSPP